MKRMKRNKERRWGKKVEDGGKNNRSEKRIS
jgi:hypothetical protein